MSDIENLKSSLSSISFMLDQLNNILDSNKEILIPHKIAEAYIQILDETYPKLSTYLTQFILPSNNHITNPDKSNNELDNKQLQNKYINSNELTEPNFTLPKYSPRKNKVKLPSPQIIRYPVSPPRKIRGGRYRQ